MKAPCAPELTALEDRFVLEVREVVIGGRRWRLDRPRSADDLINEADFALDERLPYWADLWPSAVALATVVSALQGDGRRAVEFGCGLGLPTLAAANAGFDVTATDYYEDALRFARRNAVGNLGRDIATRLVDWCSFPADLGRFDLVLASDVLYERRYAPLVARSVVHSLAPGGVALVADPGRAALEGFLRECVALGARVGEHRAVGHVDGTATLAITIHEVRLG
ncbi:MAG TPA: methyltransferase domain-containing protein [Gemmatimonadaceae bacterium]